MNIRFADAIRGRSHATDARTRRDARRGKPGCESLEGRVVLSTMGGGDSQGADRLAQVASQGSGSQGSGGQQDIGKDSQRGSDSAADDRMGHGTTNHDNHHD